MRSGTCGAPQQTLTPEAASVLKHSLSLAARRGHSHVTPLHVASTLLSSKQSSSSSSTITLLRRACLKSHPPNPLHSRALELCFNVALNRLPTSPPLLHSPSLSNALIAALKRAQAHQRRGSSCSSSSSSSLDHHHHPHHPLLTIKVELHHLIISILDDPSVSRVMREAGFSSTCVKNNIQHYANTILISPPSSPIINSHFFSPQTPTPLFFSSPPPSNSISTTHNAASKFVFDVFLGIISKNNNNNNTHKTTGNNNNNNNKNKNNSNNNCNNVVVLGDSLGVAEGVVFEVMRKLKMGAEVPHELKGVKFLEFPLFMGMSSSSYSSELKRKLGECCSNNNNGNGGVVVYVGDLKWIVERNNNNNNNSKEGEGEGEEGVIDGLVGEIERLLVEGFNGGGDNGNNNNKIKIWVVAVATYQTYMRCQMRQPPLETQWALHALALPSSGLGLSLHPSSVYDSRLSFFSQATETKPFLAKEEHDQKLTCCGECTSNFENEVHHLKTFNSKQVPSWLQPHSKDEIAELKRKWNKLCSSLHRDGCVQSLMGKTFSYSSSYPWWPKFHESNSIYFTDHQTPKPLQSSNSFVPRFRRQQSCTTIEFDFGNATTKHNQEREPSLNSLKHMVGKEVKITLALGNPLFCESSAESMEMESERKSQRGEILKALQENVPWQSESIPCIAEAVVSAKKNERSIQWILIEGNDFIGKRKMSVAIAESAFGSVDYLLNLNAKSEEMGISQSEMLEKALKSNRELVILVEDVDLADSQFMKLLEDGFQSGKLGEVKEESIEKVIFILTKDDDDSSDKKKNRASSSSSSSSSSSVIEMTLKIESREKPNSDHKRKAEWEIENKSKNQKTKANMLDLNLKANEEEEEEDDDDEETEQKSPNGQISPISSDLTLETTIRNGFLESISNRFILNKKSRQESEMKRELRGKMGEAYKENCKKWENSRFRVEEGVLEGIIDGFGSFSNKMFEKWVKEIFQTSLEGGRYGGGKGEGGIDISLCLDHKHILEEEEDDGYMGSCLPKKIKLSSMDSKWFFL